MIGVVMDPLKNEARPLPVDFAAPRSRVRILAIATNEEVAIARASYALLANPRKGYRHEHRRSDSWRRACATRGLLRQRRDLTGTIRGFRWQGPRAALDGFARFAGHGPAG